MRKLRGIARSDIAHMIICIDSGIRPMKSQKVSCALAAYQPIFLGVGLVFLAAGFWRVYRRPRVACAEGECGTPASNRLAKTALWLATVLIGLAVLFPYLAPLFLDV